MYLLEYFDNLLQTMKILKMQNPPLWNSSLWRLIGIMWIDLDLLYSIQETSCQYFGCFIFTTHKRSLGQGNIFAPVCHSVHRGEYLGKYTPPWAGTPPCRYTPQAGTPSGQVHTPWVGTPPSQVHPTPGRYPQAGTSPQAGIPWVGTPPWAGTPPRQVHPTGQVHPREGTHPISVCWDTVNKRAVRILLECILVLWIVFEKYNVRLVVYYLKRDHKEEPSKWKMPM